MYPEVDQVYSVSFFLCI